VRCGRQLFVFLGRGGCCESRWRFWRLIVGESIMDWDAVVRARNVAMGLRDGRWGWRSERNRRSDSVAFWVGRVEPWCLRTDAAQREFQFKNGA
jgi:hypothetical protein